MVETFTNDLINNTIYHLLNFEKHSNFQSAAREAAISNNFQIVLFTEDFNEVFTVETRHQTSIETVVNRVIEKDAVKGSFTMLDVEGLLTYWGPVHIDSVKYYLLLVDNDDLYTDEEIRKLAGILELAMGMWKYTPSRDIRAELIKAVRRGNRSLARLLAEEGGFDTTHVIGAFVASGVPKEESMKAVSAFEEKTGVRILRNFDGDEMTAIIFEPEEMPAETERAYDEMWDHMQEAGANTIVFGDRLSDLEEIADFFQLVNECWPFLNTIFRKKKVFTKYELALASNTINISLKGGVVKKYYLDLLAPFNKLSENKGKQLFDTLCVFMLDSGMKVADAAEEMGVHANTVQYRLKRIKDLFGIDVTEGTIFPGLMIAFAITRIENLVRSL